MAWFVACCCQPCQVCRTKCRDEKYVHIEYKTLAGAPLTTLEKMNQVVLTEQTGKMYSPHPIPMTSLVTTQPPPTTSQDMIGRDPYVQFSMYYDIQRRELDVQLTAVCNLPDIGEKCSTKVYTLLSSIKLEIWMESKTVSDSHDPLFNQIFEFKGVLMSELREMVLVFQIHHYSPHHSKNVYGLAKLLMKNADVYGAQSTLKIGMGQKVKQDPSKNKGDVLLVTTYKENSTLEGSLMRVTNLSRSNLPDPYVQIDVFFKDQHQYEWTSSVKNRTASPVYNEPFQFDITGMDINDISLKVTVYDHHKVRKATVIGKAVLGHTSHIQSGRDHWADLIQRCGQPVSYWHTLTTELIV